MALRIRSQWQAGQRNVSLEDNSTALAYVIWQVALAAAKNLHAEDFNYETDDQRVGVITEYLCFLVHVADRFAHTSMADDERERYITTLANETARHLQRNVEDISGRGDYRGPYITLLNQRSSDYSTTSFNDNNEAGYDMLRCLGHAIQQIMGNSQTNRWAIDQVMEIDAPETVDHIRKAYRNLFNQKP